MGIEEWPPKMLGDMANFGYAIEPIVHSLLLHASSRTLDPNEADWFYVPFYAACSFRESMHTEPVYADVSQHEERLRVLENWLLTSDLPKQHLGVKTAWRS
jgi:hypothetical protein